MEVSKGDPELQCWFFGKPYTDMYLMRGGTHQPRALEFKMCHGTSVRNPISVGWHKRVMFMVLPRDRHLHYVSVPASWQNVEVSCMLCIPSPPLIAYCSNAFGDNTPWFGHLLLETSIIEFTIMCLVCFIHATEHCVPDSFLFAPLWVLTEGGHLCANERVLVPLPNKLMADVLKRGFLRLISDCNVNPVSAIFALARASEID